MKLADLALDLPQLTRQPDLLGERLSFPQVIYRPLSVAFPLAKARQGALVGYPNPLIRLGGLGETERLFSGESFVLSPK